MPDANKHRRGQGAAATQAAVQDPEGRVVPPGHLPPTTSARPSSGSASPWLAWAFFEKSILFPATASASILSANAVPRSVHPYPICLYSFVFYFFHSRISAIHRVKDSIDPRESLSVPASPSALFTVNSPLLIFLPFFTHLGKTILYCSSCQQ